MSDQPPTTAPLAGIAVGAVVLVALTWLLVTLVSGGDSEDPADAQLECLDVQHRPTPEGAGPSVIHVGLTVTGPAEQYRVDLEVEDGAVVASVPVPSGELSVVSVPTERSEVTVGTVTAIARADEGDGARTDISEAVMGPEPRLLRAPADEGPVREDVPVCPIPASGAVHPGYVFAAPVPAYAQQGVAPADGPLVDQIDDFLAGFDDAHQRGDSATLFAMLHPAAIEGYGDEICRAHVAATTGEVPPLALVSAAPVPEYRFVRPGGADRIHGVVVVDAAAASAAGQTARWRFNLVSDGEQISWLSWCGN